MTLKELKKLLKKYNIRPSRRLGQNFLIDEKVLRKIIEAAELSKNDIVLEIGPGIGNLTVKLAKRVKKVVAVEKDQRMIEILKELLEGWKIRNVRIVEGDIRKINLKSYILNLKSYKVVANIPYYLTSYLIRKFLECNEERPRYMILMVQKEVAQRIVARPPDMSILAVSVQFYAKAEIISFVSKKSFWPSPKVNSAIIKIIPRKSALPIRINPLLFFKIVKAGFSQPRKQLINNLSRLNFSSKNLSGQAKNPKLNRKKIKSWLWKNKIQPTQRAETLNLKDWINLTKNINPVNLI